MASPSDKKLPLPGYITGYRDKLEVFVDGMPLEIGPSYKLRNHSPDFCWGYHGQGPSQLALALLLEFKATDEEALDWHQEFKGEIIAGLPDADFEIPMSRVIDWVEARRMFAKEFKE